MKKKILGLVAMVLVAVTIVGGTYAYLSNTTGVKTNTFIMGEGVSAQIAEPKWDGLDFGETGPAGTDKELGIKIAESFKPGAVIPKNPIVKNTTGKTPVYVAVKIGYGEVGSLAELEKFATIDFNSDKWEFNADKTVAYYKTELAANAITEPVFNNVTIKAEATTDTMKNFNITLQGYVCQTTDVSDGAGNPVTGAVNTLKAVFGLN